MIVVTSFSTRGYEAYGKRFIASFDKYWPDYIKLYVYIDGEYPEDDHERVVWVPLENDPERSAFIRACPIRDSLTDYRYRPIRYSNKVFAFTDPWLGEQPIIWLDGDCETVNPVTPDMLAQVMPEGGQIASYLARPYYRHTETGFLGFAPEAVEFRAEMRKVYTSGELFQLREWHDCSVFDHVRVKFERRGERFRNLCPAAMGLDVFPQSPLAKFVVHNKGPKRKQEVYGDAML